MARLYTVKFCYWRSYLCVCHGITAPYGRLRITGKAAALWVVQYMSRTGDIMEINKIYNQDCITFMRKLSDNFVNFTLTDIPYDGVNRSSNGIRNFDKDAADILTFNLLEFCEGVYRVTKNSICIFCGKEQFSFIYDYFAQKHGTTRCIVWEKTNPSPVNGQYIYLSGVELAVWFKKTWSKNI